MRRLSLVLALVLAFAYVFGTYLNYAAEMDVSICDAVKTPEKFSGKFVRMTGRVSLGPEVSFISATCESRDDMVSLEYPNAEWRIPAPFEIQKDDMFATFEMILEKYSVGMGSTTTGDATPRALRHVDATFIGRFDGPDRLTVKDASGNILTRKGYGHQNQFQNRLVIRSVERITVSR